MIVGIIHEFFKFLVENQDVLESERFLNLIKKIAPDVEENWKILSGIALQNKVKITAFSQALTRIRNNVAFHYYQAGPNLRTGFIKRFFSKTKIPQSKELIFL